MSTINSGRAVGRTPGEEVDGEDRLAGTCAREHEIGGGDRSTETVEPDRHATDAMGELRSAVGRTVGDEDLSGSGAMQRDGDTLAHGAGADDEHAPALETTELVDGHLDRGVADRGGATADPGLGAGALADAEGVAEQQVEAAAGAALGLRDLPGLADLTEDLALTDDRRVEPGRDLEQVGDGRFVVLREQIRVQLVGREVADVAQEVADVGVRAVELLGDRVHLGAVARAQHRDLADVVAGGEPGHRLADRVRGERDPLEQGERTAAMVHSDDEDRHATPTLRARAASHIRGNAVERCAL